MSRGTRLDMVNVSPDRSLIIQSHFIVYVTTIVTGIQGDFEPAFLTYTLSCGTKDLSLALLS